MHRVYGAFEGETVLARGAKKKGGIPTGRLLHVIHTPYTGERLCKDFRLCGGCLSQHLSLKEQRSVKEREVLQLFEEEGIELAGYEGLTGAPQKYMYRNKVDFSFGDQVKGGPLHLGFHQRAMNRNVLDTSDCLLIHEDMRRIRTCIADYFLENPKPFYNQYTHEGLLRHLLVRRSEWTGELLVALVISSQGDVDGQEIAGRLKALDLEGAIRGCILGRNDNLGNFLNIESQQILFGEEYIVEELLGRRFLISPLSFFQTNTDAAKILFSKVKEWAGEGRVLWDLYCGTGAIGQILAGSFEKVIGIELSEQAVEAAKVNARRNGIGHCSYFQGDVKDAQLAGLERPNLVIIDPPRAGLHPKVSAELLELAPERILYVSCNPKTQCRDLLLLQEKYTIEKSALLDLYPNTPHVECVTLMSRTKE